MNQTLTRRLRLVPPFKLNRMVRNRRRWYSSSIESDKRADYYKMYNGPIVISGISGRFPKSNNMEELKQKLLNGEELTTESSSRWLNKAHPERFGFIDCIDKFDAAFFNMTPRQANQNDPQMRLLLEAVFEAMIDAGLNPTQMRGTRTAVFSGAYGNEAADYNLYHVNRDNAGYYQLAFANFMIPGRISFAFDLQGPSSHMCTACSSSFTALETAVSSIILGKCDAAVVTGSTLHLNPQTHLDLLTMNVLARDGRCKTFDEKADGFARAEAAAAIIIQKAPDARRRYATIVNIRSNSDGFKHEGVMYPNGKIQERLLRETYEQVGLDPGQISYMDAHGTGTTLGDPEELQAISDVFCKSPVRTQPLLVGSVKSNMGHTEAAAGMCSLAKTIVAIQSGTIPPNLHFNKPKPEQEHLFDGSLKVVTEPTPFDGGLIGISSFGIGGTNYHCILQPGPRRQNDEPTHDLPVLIPISGRSEDRVEDSIKQAFEHSQNPEYAYLVQNAYQRNIPGNSWRGYGLLQLGEAENSISVESCDASIRPVWMIFPGMGSQWNEMGKDLMKIEPFAESILRSKATLKNIGIDLEELLKPNNQAIFDDIHYAVMTITTMQMALYDTVKELGLLPEGFIGHSTGEFLCAYADGCFTAEETLLVTDARGRAFKESRKVIGGMASVGMSWDEVQARLPEDLELACHNAAQNVTVSGPLESVNKFVKELKDEGKFAVVVNSCGIAAHSKHVQDAADLLKKYIADIITGDKPRTSRWISTSIPEDDWGSPMAKCASPDYFDNNLRAPVLFYEALQHVPSKALVVEISPKGFFQAILKESTPKDCVHVAPMSIKAEDKLSHFFHSVGQMFLSGVDVEIDKLYPAVATPVSCDTPALSPLVKWDHEQSWKMHMLNYPLDPGYELIMDLQHPNYTHLVGHKLEDRLLFPATGYLVLAWLQYTENRGQQFDSTPVVFNNVVLRRATIISEQRETTLNTMLSGSGNFEFSNEGDVVVTGHITSFPENQANFQPGPREESDYLPLDTHDIYKEFRLRGYNYSGLFQGIQRIDNEGKWADLAWTGNWTSFLDTLLQTSILCTTQRNLALPVDFERIVIDPIEFLKHIKEAEDGQEHPTVRVTIYPYQNKIQCPGIELKGLQATIVARKGQRGNLAYEKYAFCPYVESSNLDTEPHLWEMVDLVLENNRNKDLKVMDVFAKMENSLARTFQHILTLKPLRESDLRMLTLESEAEKMEDKDKQIATLITKELQEELVPEVAADLIFLDEPSILTSVSETLKASGFLLVHSEQSELDSVPGVSVISRKTLANKTLTLLRKVVATEDRQIAHVAVDNANFNWLTELQETIAKPADEVPRVYVTSQSNPNNGVLGLVNCLRQEEGGERIRCIFDPEKKLNLDFTNPDSQLKEIIQKDLVMNVLKNNQLGSYRHVPLEAETNGVTKVTDHAYISTLTPGDLTSLRWIESPNTYFERNQKINPKENQKMYKVAYAAMNFRDVLLATGTIPIDPSASYKDAYMGFEFSGFDENGRKVMGLTMGKGLASSVIVDPRFVFPVPDGWTLEQAATIPVVYATVLYAFHSRGHIKPGHTVLIHAGTGGVGQAAISVALNLGCKVLTTVGTPEKRELIKKLYPEITDDCIGNSRDTSFEAQFMELTKGKGADIILNSLADDKLMATVRCLAVNGKFLEIGVYDAFKNTPLGMRPFLKNIDFQGVELYHELQTSRGEQLNLQKMFDDGIASGAIRPLPTHVFEKDQIEEAFRFMAGGKHMGKLLIKVRDEDKPNEPLNLPAVGRCYFPEDKSYVIVGGLGGLGLEVGNWLVDRGARHLILTSRSGLATGYQSLCLRKWKSKGVTVETPTVDLSNKEAAEKFMSEVTTKYSIGGIFNSALVLNDEVFPSQTVEAFEEVCAPKATVTENLDELSRKYCKDLDYFVVFSSSACGRGNADQTNYGWANSVMERICENRMADGLHGLAIQWGVLGQVGVVAEKIFKNMDGTEVLMGTLPQNVESCLEVLDAALQQGNAIASSIVVAEKGKKKGDKTGLLARMAKIFGIKDINSLSPEKKLTELGMDSLIGVELKQTLEREYDMPVTKELLLSLTVGDLKAIDAGTFSAERAAAKNRGKAADVNVVPFILHDECMLKLNDRDSAKSLYVVHGIEGGADIFQPLAGKLDVNVYGLQFGEHAYTVSIPSIAEAYIAEIKAIQPEGPYSIAGYSAGGSIAYEIVSQLEQEHGDKVDNFVLLDGCPSWEGGDREARCKQMVMGLAKSRNLLADLPEDKIKQFEDTLTGDIDSDTKLLADLAAQVGGLEVNLKSLTMYLRLGNAIADYYPEIKYNGNTTLIQATMATEQTLAIPNEDYNISKYCLGPVARHKVEGDHMNFLTEEHVDSSAEILNKVLS